MMAAEINFRKLEAPQVVDEVAHGAKSDNGEEVRDAT